MITSSSCSIKSIVLSFATSVLKQSFNFFTSLGWSPILGSSNIKRVCPIFLSASSFTNFKRCASPPDRVPETCPSF
ncbi:MAG: hypothetical protein ACOX3T_01185 [Bdellovibrionota bacterium]